MRMQKIKKRHRTSAYCTEFAYLRVQTVLCLTCLENCNAIQQYVDDAGTILDARSQRDPYISDVFFFIVEA